jgi:hypothetical protein
VKGVKAAKAVSKSGKKLRLSKEVLRALEKLQAPENRPVVRMMCPTAGEC